MNVCNPLQQDGRQRQENSLKCKDQPVSHKAAVAVWLCVVVCAHMYTHTHRETDRETHDGNRQHAALFEYLKETPCKVFKVNQNKAAANKSKPSIALETKASLPLPWTSHSPRGLASVKE